MASRIATISVELAYVPKIVCRCSCDGESDGSMNLKSPSNSRREANGDQLRNIAVKQKYRVPMIATAYTCAPDAIPIERAANRKIMSLGSLMGVLNRTNAIAPMIPNPLAMLFPIAMIMTVMTMVANTMVCRKERAYEKL